MKKLKNDLTPSIIQNLSMCSLENFHTCFLTWLGQNYPNEFLKVLIGESYSNAEIKYQKQINYGKNNILDLQIEIIEGNKTKYVVVENKLKSFPTNEQLVRYQTCFQNQEAEFILLSLAPMLKLPNNWKYMSYSELANKMLRAFVYKNDYDKFIIEDYINVIKTISNAFPKENTDKYDLYNTNPLDDYGLKDIYIKYRASQLTDFIKEKINKDDWQFECSFHNKKGTIDISKEFNNPSFKIGIQIEGNQYRYYFITLKGNSSKEARKTREQIAQKLYANGFWFKNTKTPSMGRLYNNFCGYNPDFIYRYFILNKYFGKENLFDVSYTEITEQIQNDINNLEKNMNDIYKVLTD